MANLSRIMVFVKEMPKMIAFYRDVIGMREAPGGSEGWQVLQSEGCEIALHAIPEQYAKDIVIEDPPRPRSASVFKLCFAVDDPKATRQELLARGVQMFEPKEGPGYVLCDGTDPEGNMLQFTNH